VCFEDHNILLLGRQSPPVIGKVTNLDSKKSVNCEIVTALARFKFAWT